MGSPSGADSVSVRPSAAPRDVLSWRMVAFVWIPILAIGLLHYLTPHEELGLHNILRRLYYLPIVVAAFLGGLRGALLASIIVSITYLPHAFFNVGHGSHSDPAPPLEKALEIVLYNIIGAVAGYLADAEHKRRVQLQIALEEQQHLQRQLVRAGRLSALGEVVAGIAHEIKNPLHALQGTAEIVDPLIPADSDEARMWQIHKRELDRLGRVADRFLSFAKPAVTEARPVDLRTVAQRVEEILAADARNKGVAISVDAPDASVNVIADRDQLAQVALNIAVNAVQAIGDGGGKIAIRVLTELSDDGTDGCLVVENDGPPIEADAMDHLFDPFWTRTPGGTGLGLSIAERIVEQYGGQINVENAGMGVAFSVCFPLADGA